MAQHDYIIANQSGAAFRSDLNNGLAAAVSNNSGAAQPSTTYAYQWWADTTTGLLKLRNAANNAWITVGTLTGGVLAGDGTAALPSIAFASDTNTGAFRAGTNQYGIATSGVERVEFGATEVVFNDVGANYDLRIEGDTNPNLFKIDAGLNQVQVANINGGPLAGFRNLIINANPTINQRAYVSGTATTAANQYTLDRWRVVTSGQSITWTDSANVRTVTAPAGGVEQVIEGTSIFTGTYTLSWTGTATATVAGSAVSNGGNVSLTGGTNTTVRFSSGTFSKVQLEPGTVATPFEQRPVAAVLALCQRYYFDPPTNWLAAWGGVAGDIQDFSTLGCLPATMRAAPTASGITFVANNCATPSVNYLTVNGVSYSTTSSANGGASFRLTAGSFSAEL